VVNRWSILFSNSLNIQTEISFSALHPGPVCVPAACEGSRGMEFGIVSVTGMSPPLGRAGVWGPGKGGLARSEGQVVGPKAGVGW